MISYFIISGGVNLQSWKGNLQFVLCLLDQPALFQAELFHKGSNEFNDVSHSELEKCISLYRLMAGLAQPERLPWLLYQLGSSGICPLTLIGLSLQWVARFPRIQSCLSLPSTAEIQTRARHTKSSKVVPICVLPSLMVIEQHLRSSKHLVRYQGWY